MNQNKEIFTNDELQCIRKNFTRLKDKTYLDYAGAALFPEAQLQSYSKDLIENLYPNPHTSKYTSDCIDQVRFEILKHFGTDPSEYSLIFTSGATGSLKIIAECFDYTPKLKVSNIKDCYKGEHGFIYLHDNHTSILGMRDVVKSKSAKVIGISRDDLFKNIKNEIECNKCVQPLNRALFAFPAQCNFNGYKYPLEWIHKIKNGSLNDYTEQSLSVTYDEWIVLLDAASYVSTNRLDLSKYKPDFVCISFYKIFGYPTGLGALLVKNTSEGYLCDKTYYGGGTVEIAMSHENYHVKRLPLHERFEDGTIPFLSILAVKHGFETLNKMIPKKINDNIMDTISAYTFELAQYFYQKSKSLCHYNNEAVFVIYADSHYDDPNSQGGIVNFNLVRSNGNFIGYAEVIHMAELFNIYIRSGCFCNPGACQRHLKLSNDDLLNHHKAGHKCGDDNDLVNGVPTGSLRVSFGYMITKNEIDKLIDMIVKCFVEDSPICHLTRISDSQNRVNNEKQVKNDKKYSSIGELKEIHIYPVKSCGAYKVEKYWQICEKGLKYDRDWMIVDESGVVLTQKRDTRMCLIKPFIDLENNQLILTFPEVKSTYVPLDMKSSVIKSTTVCHSKVCGDKIQGYDCGNEVADWLFDVLGLPGLRLLKQTNSRQNKKAAMIQDLSLSFTNQAQYLLVNVASIKWLSTKIQSEQFQHRLNNLLLRFRGNFIIETENEFEEFAWSRIKIGTNIFQIQGSCTRCQMICIDQENGEKTTEPLRTISKEFNGKLHFGVYLSHEFKSNDNNPIIRLNDNVFISEN